MGKSNVLKFSLSGERKCPRVRHGSDEIDKVIDFTYISVYDGMEEELKHRFEEGAKIVGGLVGL